MTTQHTPGPWKVGIQSDETGRNYYVECHEASAHGVSCWGMVARTCGTQPMPEKAANASLIAAAPDMLEALRVVASLPGFEHDEPYSALVAAAIAKATGV